MKFLIYLIFFFATFQVAFSQDASYYYIRGVEYCDREDYLKAIEEFNKAIKADPNYAAAYDYRGNAHNNLKLYQEAIKDYDKAIELDPNFAYTYYNRGIAKDNLTLFKEALQDYNKAIEIDANYSFGYTNRGVTKHNLGLNTEAIQDFNKALEIDSNNFYAWTNRGMVKAYLGRHEESMEDFNKAIELNPYFKDSYFNRGIAKYFLGLPQEAIEDYDKVIELDRRDADSYHNRGVAKKDLGLYQEAMQDFNQALEINPDQVRAKIALKNLRNQLSDNKLPKSRIWAVAVGLSNYKYSEKMTTLNTTVKNVLDFAHFLEDIDVNNERIPVLINDEAEKDNILQTLKSTFLDENKVNEEDMIFFLYSGHGESDGNKPGICPYEYDNPQQLITDQEILDILQKSPARYKLCIIEACKTQAKSLAPSPEESLNSINKERNEIPGGIIYITSTKVGEESFEMPLKGAIFSYFFLQGVKQGKADTTPKDGIIRVKELFDYIKKNVANHTNNQQIPQINSEGYDSNIPILEYE